MSFLPARAGIGDNDTPDQNDELESYVEDQRGQENEFSIAPENSMAEERRGNDDASEVSDVESSLLSEDDRHQRLRSQEDNEEDNSNIDRGGLASTDGPLVGVNSPTESIETPDNPPSIQPKHSLASSPGSVSRSVSASILRASPNPSLRPFDRRFHARLDSSPGASPRALSPAFLDNHSRRSSLASQYFPAQSESDSLQAPWDVIKWIKLKKITNQVFSEIGRRNFGSPTCIVVSAFIAVGTSRGVILVFDYNQNLKSIIGPGTDAVKSGPVLSLAVSTDQTAIAGGHANGGIFTWEVSRPAKPFLHLPPIDLKEAQAGKAHGHGTGIGVLHLGFLGARRTALVSADGRGMAFSHLATRGLGAVGRTITTNRILGRYPDDTPVGGRIRKPSAVLACSTLPLGNVEQATDAMGLVAMLTPYLLVIVSTIPIAQTQHKAGRPKDVAAHSALSGCLAWFPSVRLKNTDPTASEVSKTKLVYCWCNILTILELSEESSEGAPPDRPPVLSFRARSRWRAEEPVVAVQWLSRSILAILTITQQMVILEDHTMTVTETVDLVNKQISHFDFFSSQLQSLVEQLDETDVSMHGVVADAFSTSFRAYKGRLFVLGVNDLSVGTLSNWSDRLAALVDDRRYIEAIELARQYYLGEADTLAVGLPTDETIRQNGVRDKLLDIMSNMLRYSLRNSVNGHLLENGALSVQDVSTACFTACVTTNSLDFLFEDVYDFFEEKSYVNIFLEGLGPYVLSGQITSIPPAIVKELVDHYVSLEAESQLEEMICRMDASALDIDQITNLCKRHGLYEALFYIWNQALDDCITPLVDLMAIIPVPELTFEQRDTASEMRLAHNAHKIFPYLAYSLTGRVYPTGDTMSEERAFEVKTQLYWFLFAGTTIVWPTQGGKPIRTLSDNAPEPAFPYLRLLLKFDAASFLSALNEAFEDSFLNGPSEFLSTGISARSVSGDHRQTMNRQQIINVLWEILYTDEFTSDQTIYLDMFIARNLSKFPQFILLSGTSLHRVLIGLCHYPSQELAEDCQLSVEYVLSMHHPVDVETMIPSFRAAGFYRVVKSIYKSEKQYGNLLELYFEDSEGQDEVFICLEDCLRQRGILKERQLREVLQVMRSHAADFVALNTIKTAEVIGKYLPDWHEVFLSVIKDTHDQFVYLRTILEPSSIGLGESIIREKQPTQNFVEQYVRLMCAYEPSHVVEYIALLHAGDLRLEQVLPDMESGGVVDAAVVLTAREGHVRDAMTRLLRHLETLEAALLGVLEGESSDGENSKQAIEEILKSLEKYSRVGIWLCQRQMKSIQMSEKTTGRPTVTRQSSYSAEGDLTVEELLWLGLIDGTVRIIKNVTAALEGASYNKRPSEDIEDEQQQHDKPEIMKVLRTLIQQTFTALLTSTSSTNTSTINRTQHATHQKLPSSTITTTTTTTNNNKHRHHLSFLRILRAFLTRATISSPSLSELRQVLESIFSAYAYEESLLSLSNKLLQEDLFVHVADLSQRRQRGWRPKRQVCEICGRKTWGPGVGGKVWEAWKGREVERREKKKQYADGDGDGDGEGEGGSKVEEGRDERGVLLPMRSQGQGKGQGKRKEVDAKQAMDKSQGGTDAQSGVGNGNANEEDIIDPLLIFSFVYSDDEDEDNLALEALTEESPPTTLLHSKKEKKKEKGKKRRGN
ncbi:MAG: hypothetical protein M1823_001986 [Watsoniomyces obsoletus]|nr:MAG: hypothetical protein M1823_001986 [Watsoniomyces obsoletus]